MNKQVKYSSWTNRRRVKRAIDDFMNSLEYDGDHGIVTMPYENDIVYCPVPEENSVEFESIEIDQDDTNYDTQLASVEVDDDDETDYGTQVETFEADRPLDIHLDIHNNTFLDDDSNECFASHLKEDLAIWATQFHIPGVAIGGLLKTLHVYHPDLPVDQRTLLHTPRVINIKMLPGGGEYVHFGIRTQIENMIDKKDVTSNHLELQFGIDRLPLFKSSNTSLWPILCHVKQSSVKDPLVVGAYYGVSKPKNLEAFFQDFIYEMTDLIHNGLTYKNITFDIEIHSFICDAPARAMIKNIKGHGGYFGCDRCSQEGEWEGKVIYPDTNAPLRTDAQFNEMVDEEHHLGPSPLRSLPIEMISQFPIDYMHLVCLGVMRRLLLCWLKGPLPNRLPTRNVITMSEKLVGLAPHIPREFARKPRSLSDIMRWKATELRQFLLYTGPVVLLNVLSEELYKNFLLLFLGITILVSDEFAKKYCKYAKEILKTFVENLKILYGKGFIVYNVHGLIHLAEDVEKFGALDNFSAFIFENKLKSVKKLIRKPTHVLQQLSNRLSEAAAASKTLSATLQNDGLKSKLSKQHSNGPVPVGLEHGTQYQQSY